MALVHLDAAVQGRINYRSMWIGIQFWILIRIQGVDDKKLLNFKAEKYPFLSEFAILYPYEATWETSSP